MQDIKDLTLKELEDKLKEFAQPPFHARQIFNWIYQKGGGDFTVMSDLPAPLREKLKENFYIFGLKLIKTVKSKDGTEKFLFALEDKNLIEAVVIPAEKRITACISTQVGCKFRCGFCASGLLGFKRNLTCGEILEEVLYLKNNSAHQKLTHIVFMGIGEPLDNYDNVLKAVRIINSPYSLNIGARRITISTSGIIPAIKRLSGEKLQIELSVSLHAADDKTRRALMPINKIYPLKDLIAACAEYIKKTDRQVTFEYILIHKVNSDLPSALNLGKILRGLNCKVNLIPVNPVRNKPSEKVTASNGVNPIREAGLEPPNKLEALLFRKHLIKQGIAATLRKRRGEDIEAACGQLRLKYEK